MVHRSKNSHQLKLDALPFSARLRREDPFRSADASEWKAAADRIAGTTGWYAVAGTWEKMDCKMIHFATPAEAEEMQKWIADSGIETRPVPERFNGPQLSVG